VKELQLPFREAHHATARIVKLASASHKTLEQLTLAELQSVEPRIRQEVMTVLSAAHSAASRTSFGGTAPKNVKQAIADAKARFGL